MSDFNFHVGSQADFLKRNVSTLATTVYQCRTRLGWTQTQLAAAAGVNESTIIAAESGMHIGMSLQVLFSIAWALELQTAELFGYVNTRPRVSTDEYNLVLAARKIYGGG